MTLVEIIPVIRSLSRAEKIELMQALVAELARDEGIALAAGSSFPIWSPHHAHEAADALLAALAADGAEA